MIDIHCHVLWGVDDASQDRETTKKMLQIAVEDGIGGDLVYAAQSSLL